MAQRFAMESGRFARINSRQWIRKEKKEKFGCDLTGWVALSQKSKKIPNFRVEMAMKRKNT